MCRLRLPIYVGIHTVGALVALGTACLAQPPEPPYPHYSERWLKWYSNGLTEEKAGLEASVFTYRSGGYVEAHGDTSYNSDHHSSSAHGYCSAIGLLGGVDWTGDEEHPPASPVTVTYSGTAQATALAFAEVSSESKEDEATGHADSGFGVTISWIAENGQPQIDIVPFNDDAAVKTITVPQGSTHQNSGNDVTGYQSFSHQVISWGDTCISPRTAANAEPLRTGDFDPCGSSGTASASISVQWTW